MPEAPPAGSKPSGGIITRKVGPLPVWGWALGLLAAAWVYAKYRNNQTAAASTASTTASPEGQAVAPQFVIENNMPATVGSANAPVPSQPSAPPVVTPPGTQPQPPIIVPIKGPPGKGGGTPTGSTPIKGGGKKPPVSKKPPQVYRVEHGDTLTSIAQRHGLTEAELWAFNIDPKNRSASAIATLKRRGQNVIYAGEEILIPQK